MAETALLYAMASDKMAGGGGGGVIWRTTSPLDKGRRAS